MTETLRFPPSELERFCTEVFVACGVPPEDAAVAADVLVTADRRGIDSHGVPRLAGYVAALRGGATNPTPDIRVVAETASTATVDGDNGLGLVVGPRANEIAMQKAFEAGSGWVAVRGSNHYGIAGWYVLRAVERKMVGWSMTNATALVAPAGGTRPLVGTNPLAFGFPAGTEDPFILDMATSVVAHGKLEIAMREGRRLPPGWAIDADGNPTDDPAACFKGGSLLPLGSDAEHSVHKGWGLAAMVDLLCGPLAGAAWGPHTPMFTVVDRPPADTHGRGIGHFFGAMRLEGFGDPEEILAAVDEWIRTARAAPAAAGARVMIPGDPEREAEAERTAHGIPLLGPVVDSLRGVADQLGVAPPEPLG